MLVTIAVHGLREFESQVVGSPAAAAMTADEVATSIALWQWLITRAAIARATADALFAEI